MFIGHYGAALAIKRAKPAIPSWVLFVAVQWVDILFCSFILIGVERMRIIPGFTAYNSYDLYYMPYTHSLEGSLLWAAGFGGVAAWLLTRKDHLKATRMLALWLGLAVFSHFLLDLPMHVRDLPLTLASAPPKLGFGLWNHRTPALAFELAVFLGGLLLFPGARGWKFRVYAALSLALLIATPFMPPPGSTAAFAVSALASYAAFAGLARWAL